MKCPVRTNLTDIPNLDLPTLYERRSVLCQWANDASRYCQLPMDVMLELQTLRIHIVLKERIKSHEAQKEASSLDGCKDPSP